MGSSHGPTFFSSSCYLHTSSIFYQNVFGTLYNKKIQSYPIFYYYVRIFYFYPFRKRFHICYTTRMSGFCKYKPDIFPLFVNYSERLLLFLCIFTMFSGIPPQYSDAPSLQKLIIHILNISYLFSCLNIDKQGHRPAAHLLKIL